MSSNGSFHAHVGPELVAKCKRRTAKQIRCRQMAFHTGKEKSKPLNECKKILAMLANEPYMAHSLDCRYKMVQGESRSQRPHPASLANKMG